MSLEIALVPRQISDNNLTFSGGRETCERKIIFSLLALGIKEEFYILIFLFIGIKEYSMFSLCS